MKPGDQSKRWQRAEQLYTWYVHLYPRAHRQAYGRLMLQAFRDSYRDALATQGRIGPRFWCAVVTDEARSLLSERAAALTTAGRRLLQRPLAIGMGILLVGGMAASLAACAR